jgi:drug/metabolite transporter (DMT)-like permease
MSWFYLALLAPLLYAVVNLIDDNLLRFVYRGPYLAAAVSGLFGALPLLSLPFVHWTSISPLFASMMALAGLLTTFYYFFYFKALDVESPSIVVALFSLVPATLPIFAYYLVGERLTQQEVIGFLIILFASLGLALTEVKKFKFSRALVPVLIAVVLIDIISLLTKYVYDHAVFYPAFMFFSLGLGLGGVCFPLIMFYGKTKHDLSILQRKLRKVVPLLVLVELLGVAAEFTTNLAVSRGPVSLVNVLEGTQPMYVLIIALIFFPFAPKYFREAAERQLVKKFVLMGCIIAGLYLVGTAAV